MNIYFVYDGWSETSVWEIKFYSTRELAEVDLNSRIAKLHEEEEERYNRKLADWKFKNVAVQAIIDAGLRVPLELAWVHNAPPEKKIIFNHGLSVDYVEVQE
jgi:hypothetical protein